MQESCRLGNGEKTARDAQGCLELGLEGISAPPRGRISCQGCSRSVHDSVIINSAIFSAGEERLEAWNGAWEVKELLGNTGTRGDVKTLLLKE